MEADDVLWNQAAEEFGWTLPARAPWWARLPVMRHVRVIIAAYRIETHYRRWASVGLLSSGYDEWVLYAIWRGWC